jgi:hypothetical protein
VKEASQSEAKEKGWPGDLLYWMLETHNSQKGRETPQQEAEELTGQQPGKQQEVTGLQ